MLGCFDSIIPPKPKVIQGPENQINPCGYTNEMRAQLITKKGKDLLNCSINFIGKWYTELKKSEFRQNCS
jgi:hypothetical protein